MGYECQTKVFMCKRIDIKSKVGVPLWLLRNRNRCYLGEGDEATWKLGFYIHKTTGQR